jgi:hypothetical protein
MFTQFTNYVQKNVGTTAVTLVTVPANNQLAVNQLSCANVTGLSVTCSVTVTRSGVAIFILRNATVPPGGSLICVGESQKIVLMAGDVLQVQSSTATSIDCVVSGVLNDFDRAATVPAVVSGSNATISVAPSATTIGESGTVTFTVTTNLPNGTVVYWENIGTTNPQDFTDDLNSGAVAVSGGSASFTRTLRSNVAGVDGVGEGSETIVMIVGTTPRYLGGGVLAVASTVTVLDNPVTSGLILHLDAGNPASYPGSGTTWTDLSGSGNTGVLTNGPGYSGLNGGRITFDGADDVISIANSASLQVGDTFTVSAWINATSLTGRLGIFSTRTANPAGCWQIEVGEGNALPNGISVTGVGTWIFSSASGILTTNTWYHICYTKNGNAQLGGTLYLNSVSLTPAATTAYSIINNSDIKVVGRGAATTQNFPGSISQTLLYNRALTADEVTQNFNASRGRFGI